MSIKERLSLAPELRDTTRWPSPRNVPPEKKEVYDRRVAAIKDYLAGTSFDKIKKDHGLPKAEIYRLLGRCLEVQPDRNIAGFFALVPGTQLKPYSRKERVKATSISGKSGYAGAFLQLVSEHEELHKYIERKEEQHPGTPVSRLAREIKGEFLKKCEKHRKPNEYPFIVEDNGARALREYLGKVREHRLALVSHGAADAAPHVARTGQPSTASTLRPYEEAELDGHRGDFYFVIKLLTGDGDWVYTLPLRIWLVLMIDRASRAILGYSYRLGGTNYRASDVLRCIAHSLTPWEPMGITLPGIKYELGAGFPSSCTPAGAGRLIDALHVDNAWANTAEQIQRRLLETMGAALNVGRAGEPTARPFVERLNQALEDRGFRRLPIGFKSTSKEDRDRAYRIAAEYPVTLDELEQILDTIIANYNATVHGEHTNRSPLEYLRQWDAGTDAPMRVADHVQAVLERISQFEEFAEVKGGNGRLPFFRLKDAEYTCSGLKQMKSAVGYSVRIVGSYFGDSRFVRAFLQLGDGEVDIGIAKAMPPWHDTPLTFDQRRLAAAERRKGGLPAVEGTDAGGAWLFLREREAAERKGNANRLAAFGKLPGERRERTPPETKSARARVRPKDWISLE